MGTSLKKKSGLNFENKSCLSISIFYEELGWHVFIIDCLRPFIEKTKEIEYWHFSFSRKRGNHIKLFLISSESEANTIVIKANKCFSVFLDENPIITNKNLIPKNDFFYDFNPNSIHYGIYDDGLGTIRFKKEISQLIITLFERYKNDTIQSLPEIMIEFFAIFNEYLKLKKKEGIEVFNTLLKNEYQKYDDTNLKKIQIINEQHFENNRKQLISFIKHKQYLSEEVELYQKQWILIVNKYEDWLDFKTQHSEIYLISTVCRILDVEDRITPYFLFLNALRHIEDK